MENASKALLIAASVLIVILLIAFGMSIFNSVGDSTGDAEDIANIISGETASGTTDAMDAMGYMKDEYGNWVRKTE